MKIKNIVTVLLVVIILASCAPAATVVPTKTTMPTSTFTPIPPTPTITPTPAPENLADAKDLSKWVDDYVHAFGGKVTVNGVEVDTIRLTDEIRENEKAFMQIKEVNGIKYSFLVVNNVPLAIKQNDGLKWEKVTLRKVAEMLNFKIGTLLSSPYVPDMTLTDKLIVNEFNMATLETTSSNNTERIQNQFDFTEGDKSVQLAQDNGMYVVGDELAYGYANFEWGRLKNNIKFDQNGKIISTDLTRDQLVENINNHIKQVMTHYKGVVTTWVVVNESCLKSWHPGKWDPYVEIIGDDYMDAAFETARKADPAAVLIYNQGSNETMSSDRYQMTLQIIRRLAKKGLVDKVGLQMHINFYKWDPPSKDELIKAFKSYGVPVFIRELDVNMTDATGTPKEKSEKQTEIFKTVFEACLESGVCSEVNFWGVGDKYNWLEYQQNIPNADATILNDDLSPKPAYYAITQVLYEHVP